VAALKPFENIPNYPDVDEIHSRVESMSGARLIDAAALAKEAGNPRAVNMVMVGAASNSLPLTQDSLEEAISSLFARKGEAVVASNLKAFRSGRAA
jgi:Pyruvate/2-oxoacid:ferredoxin oxidoreductase gamma subunit